MDGVTGEARNRFVAGAERGFSTSREEIGAGRGRICLRDV
jgi:hypothetical protein